MDENLDELSFGRLLQRLRKRQKGLTQEGLATKMGTRRSTISDWEREMQLPNRFHLQDLIKALRLNEEDTRRLLRAALQDTGAGLAKNTYDDRALPSLFNVPSLRNPYFTGRSQLLRQLQRALTEKKTIALVQAISGLGGIGKTQTALEYVYRFRQNYQTILWLNASSQEALFSDIIILAHLLNLPEKESREQEAILGAVKRWLREHTNWLLIFDNADDLLQVQDVLPIGATGHILLTTRSQLVKPIAVSIRIDMMERNEGCFFLLRRCGMVETQKQFRRFSPELRTVALKIVDELGRLPLALDQAGAYIQETGCDLSRYLTRYQEQHTILLKRKSQAFPHYPESIASTWSLSFQRVRRINALAADLLALCAFLHPDAIPEVLFFEGVQSLGPTFDLLARDWDLFNEAVKDLRHFSLLKRNAETKTLTMHRLVQVVLKDTLDKAGYRQWANIVICLMNAVFPESDISTWKRCQLYLPHAQLCTALIEQEGISSPEAISLLGKVGQYLRDRGWYKEALPSLECRLVKQRQVFSGDYSTLVQGINDVAELYTKLSQFPKGLSLLREAVELSERYLGFYHSGTARSLTNFALLYDDQGNYTQAEPLFQQALHINEQVFGPEHPEVATILDNLALLYKMREEYSRAEQLFQRALHIREHTFGPDSLEITFTLTYLGLLYRELGNYAEAEKRYSQARAIREKVLGPEHDDTAQTLNNLAQLYRLQGRYDQSEQLFQYVWVIRQKTYGEEHQETATALNNLALVYREQGRLDEAETGLQRALTILTHILGEEHSRTMATSSSLALTYVDQGKYLEAETLLRHLLPLREKVHGPQHTSVARSLTVLAKLHALKGENEQAESLLLRALTIWERAQGKEHPEALNVRFRLASVYEAQGRFVEAIQEYQYVMIMREKVLGPEHRDTKAAVQSYHTLMHKQIEG